MINRKLSSVMFFIFDTVIDFFSVSEKSFLLYFLPDRYLVNRKIRLRTLHKCQMEIKEPTVHEETRVRLEFLSCCAQDLYHSNFSREACEELALFLEKLIYKHVEDVNFPLEKIDGFTSSKAVWKPDSPRMRSKSLVEMGSHIDDLRDLCGLEGDEVIEKCLSWGEMRLHDFQIITDSWHKKNYWNNSGGSHHMAVLAYQLDKQNRSVEKVAERTTWNINFEAFQELNHIKLFVLIKPYASCLSIFDIIEPIPDFLRLRVMDSLGLQVINLSPIQSAVPNITMVAVEGNKLYSKHSLKLLEDACVDGDAMSFETFLRSVESAN